MYIRICNLNKKYAIVLEKRDGVFYERNIRLGLLNKGNCVKMSDNKEAVENYRKGL